MLTREQALRGLGIVSRAGPRLHHVDPLEALRISLGHGVAVYDAAYLAASKRLQAPLYTADRRLIEALRGSGFQPACLACRDTS